MSDPIKQQATPDDIRFVPIEDDEEQQLKELLSMFDSDN